MFFTNRVKLKRWRPINCSEVKYKHSVYKIYNKTGWRVSAIGGVTHDNAAPASPRNFFVIFLLFYVADPDSKLFGRIRIRSNCPDPDPTKKCLKTT